MRWLDRIRQRSGSPAPAAPIDVDAVVADGLYDQSNVRYARYLLRAERKRLVRKQRALSRQSGRPGTQSFRAAARLGPQLGSYQMAQEMQHVEAAGRNQGKNEQAAEIERQIKRVDDGIDRLRGAS